MACENEKVRGSLRRQYERDAVITSKGVKGKEEEGIKFSDYFEWSEPLRRCPSHRLLAMLRGEQEGFLRLSVMPPEDQAVETVEKIFVTANNAASRQVKEAVSDSWSRLLAPSMETESRKTARKKPTTRPYASSPITCGQLAAAPPLGEKSVLAIDPGFRTGSQGPSASTGRAHPAP